MDVDHGQLLGRRLKDVAIIRDLDELAPVGGRAAGGRDRRRFERFAQVREDLPDRGRVGDIRLESDALAALAATVTELRGGATVLTAEAPLASMFGYSAAVRSVSQGRASFTMAPLKYGPAPAETAEAYT